ncbi:MAG: FliG C-terminal domain-containing protein [Bdellovibrionota bacterium]
MTKNIKSGFRGGVRAAAELLNMLDPELREKILANVKTQDPQMADKIRNQMFTFEDIALLDERSMQILLREAPAQLLALAMRKTSDDMQKTIFSNLSNRAGQILRDEIDSQGKRRLSEVTAAQAEIVKITKRLINEGKISR